MSLAREMVAAIAAEVAQDPALARDLAEALAPYLAGDGVGWMGAQDAATHLGLGSLDALDRLTREGLPCSQPSGTGGRRYYSRRAVDRWMERR
jgi:hypothetical protein